MVIQIPLSAMNRATTHMRVDSHQLQLIRPSACANSSTACRLGRAPITMTLPLPLTMLVHKYLVFGHPTLVATTGCRALFPSGAGHMLDHAALRNSWLRIQRDHQAPWQPFSTKWTRHVYAGCCIEDLAGAVAQLPLSMGMQGPTTVMGNSLRVVHSNYARTAKNSYAEAAMAQIEEWREKAIKELNRTCVGI